LIQKIVIFVFLTLFACDSYPDDSLSFYLVQYQIPEDWPASYEQQQIEDKHIKYLEQLYNKEVLVMAGSIQENGHRLVVLRDTSLEHAIQLVQLDPAIRSGSFGAKVNTWNVALSSLWPKMKSLPRYDPTKPFILERLDPNAPINLKKP